MSLTLASAPAPVAARAAAGCWVNDVHSALNQTRVLEVVAPENEEEIANAIQSAAREERSICASGSRHSMGGQQFARGETLLDLRSLRRVIALDRHRGVIEVEAGIEWPELIHACHALQPHDPAPWSIRQKQTGADGFTLGGSLSSNIHGRGLSMKPLAHDIESFTLIDGAGESLRCSRKSHPELFRLALGGYGLFGVISRVELRLQRRRKLRRQVKLVNREELISSFETAIREGCLYGDFQFAIDPASPDLLRRGVFCTYLPVEENTPVTAQKQLSPADWLGLLRLAYTDPAEGFRRYAQHYLASHGQTYWSDTHQLSPYLPGYAAALSEAVPASRNSSLVISELYVPRSQLAAFLQAAADLLRARRVRVIYGTIRLIERDEDSYLPWARAPYACIIFNLLTPHNSAGHAASRSAFQDLIDVATAMGGSFYLTYHRYADRARVERCYPQFRDFLALKDRYDPDARFQSDWWRHYRQPPRP